MELKISDMMDEIRDDTVPIQVLDTADIGRIRELTLEKLPVRPIRFRRMLRSLVAACLVVVLLAVPVGAELRNGYVSNLLAPLYGTAQTELVDSIGIPLGASTTVAGYTLSADAIIGDRYHFAVVYSLTREDGQKIDGRLRFGGRALTSSHPAGGGSVSYRLSEDGKTLYMVKRWNSASRIFPGKKLEEVYENLEIWVPGEKENTVVAEGEWRLSYTFRYEDTSQNIPVDDLSVKDAEGKEYEVSKILLSPIGIWMKISGPNPFVNGVTHDPYWTDLRVSVLLKDGTEIDLQDCSRGGGRVRSGEETMVGRYSSIFDLPIPLDTIAAVNICGTVVPVDLS